MNQASIDLQQLRIKHILYKSKIRSVLFGGPYDGEFFSRFGPLDTWFDKIGLVKYKYEPEIQELSQIQHDLNASVKALTTLHKNGKIDEAYNGLSWIETKSEKFLSLVLQLEKRLGNEA